MIDYRLEKKTTEVNIVKMKVSDHYATTWTVETTERQHPPKKMITQEMIEDDECSDRVKKIYDEERHDGDYETFKQRCLETATMMRKKRKRDRRSNN